jgi:hypothetical protein
VAEIAEAQRRAAQVLEAAVDRLCRAVAGACPVEVGEHVGGAALERAPESDPLGQGCGDCRADRGDDLLQLGLRGGSVRVAVGSDDALVDAPGRLDFNVRLGGEDRNRSLVLSVGEQLDPGASSR